MSENVSTTQDKLLDAAEELFATKSFDEVSIRELASAADVNIAAVNYHFQGKENLFQEVVRRRFVHHREVALQALEEVIANGKGQPSLEDVIRTLAAAYLNGTLSSDKQVTFLSLIAGEMATSKPHANDAFFKEMVAPVFQAFSRALIAAHPRLPQDQLTWVIASIVGQIHHFIFRWKKAQLLDPEGEAFLTMARVFPPIQLTPDQYITEVTEHITRFSSAAISALYPEAE